jgi:N-ethylmaleimide reductase
MMNILLNPYDTKILGAMKNRIVMSAMTRGFADHNHGATQAMHEYYKTRAQNGVALILTEGLVIHPSADGYNNVPHLSNKSQAISWRPITNDVRATGSKIFAQLWHCGPISHEDFTAGVAPVSASNIQAEGINRQNNKPFGVPIALTSDGILNVYHQFMSAAELAFEAGFDGVELHFGHGYLVDSFLDSRVNNRTDTYGGSVDNRCRFALELTRRLIVAFGAEKVIVRLSPSRELGGKTVDWPDLQAMIEYLIPSFDSVGLRMLDVSCARANYFVTSGRIIRMIRPLWPHLILGGASLTADEAVSEIHNGYLDMVTWGRHLIANPDFVQKLRTGQELSQFSTNMLKELV